MDLHELPYRLRSAWQKKRLVKKDRDKQLIQLDKLQNLLSNKKHDLPMVPLDHPYQKGWKRLFVLRHDVQETEKAEFYQAILDKINTVRYHHNKNFKKRKRRKWRFNYEEKLQSLREIDDHDWYRNKLNLSEAEKTCFYRKETWSDYRRMILVTYEFMEAWRFELVVKPHIIYAVKMHDELLEQEIKAIDNRISNNHLWPKIRRLTKGRSYHRWENIDKPQYINKLKNQPGYTHKEAYLD